MFFARGPDGLLGVEAMGRADVTMSMSRSARNFVVIVDLPLPDWAFSAAGSSLRRDRMATGWKFGSSEKVFRWAPATQPNPTIPTL
jgi:hypothetical protein